VQKRRIVIAIVGAATAAVITGVTIAGAAPDYDITTAPGTDTVSTVTQPPREDETLPGTALTFTRVQLAVASDDSNQVFGARGFGAIEKSRKALRVQVDRVRLGVVPGPGFPEGIVLADNKTPVNSGTFGDRAISVTDFQSVQQTNASGGCLSGKARARLWTRAFYSVRWNDGSLSRYSRLSNPSTEFYCTRTVGI
jgi:hypothetical protein